MSLSFATYQAYNFWGGKGLYGRLNRDGTLDWDLRNRATHASFDRPYPKDHLGLTYYSLWELKFILVSLEAQLA